MVIRGLRGLGFGRKKTRRAGAGRVGFAGLSDRPRANLSPPARGQWWSCRWWSRSRLHGSSPAPRRRGSISKRRWGRDGTRGGPQEKRWSEPVEASRRRQPATAFFFRPRARVRPLRHARARNTCRGGRFFLLTGDPRNSNVMSLIKTGGGIGPLMPGQPSGSARTVPTPAGKVSTFHER